MNFLFSVDNTTVIQTYASDFYLELDKDLEEFYNNNFNNEGK